MKTQKHSIVSVYSALDYKWEGRVVAAQVRLSRSTRIYDRLIS